jgi:predicted Zn-dependent protease with MMP-like domain
MTERFNQIEPLTCGEWKAVVRDGVCIKIEDTDDFDEDGVLDSIFLESVEEARALYEWLGRALPTRETEAKP